MAKLSKKVRFEVFKRDKFTCQYCGKAAPDVVLHCDHIHPASRGGEDDILNLVTSCVDCNLGKGARMLGDDSAVAMQREQLAALEERRQQIEMMLEWRRELGALNDDVIHTVVAAIENFSTTFTPNESGKSDIRRWLKRYTLEEILTAVDASFGQYIEFDNEDNATSESWNKAFSYIPRIAGVNKRSADKPLLRDLFYIRGILRNRLGYEGHGFECLDLLESAFVAGATVESLREFSKTVRTWPDFCDTIRDYLEDHGGTE